MAGPIAFDPAGPCVLLVTFPCFDGPYTVLFHKEILRKSGFRLKDDQAILDQEVDEKYEDPPRIEYDCNSQDSITLFKRWAYYGNFDGCDVDDLESLCTIKMATIDNRKTFRVQGFEDALVDQAIKILTNDGVGGGDFDCEVLEEVDQWPVEFRNFLIDILLQADDPEHDVSLLWVRDATLKAIDLYLSEYFLRHFASRTLEGRRSKKLWTTNICEYHGHHTRACYKVAGGTDMTVQASSGRKRKVDLREEN